MARCHLKVAERRHFLISEFSEGPKVALGSALDTQGTRLTSDDAHGCILAFKLGGPNGYSGRARIEYGHLGVIVICLYCTGWFTQPQARFWFG